MIKYFNIKEYHLVMDELIIFILKIHLIYGLKFNP